MTPTSASQKGASGGMVLAFALCLAVAFTLLPCGFAWAQSDADSAGALSAASVGERTGSDPAAALAGSAHGIGSEPGHRRYPAALFSATPFPYLPNPTTRAFIASICEDARSIGQERGLYASVMIAQAVLESGSGSSSLSKAPYNNLFGIKGSYCGQSVIMSTSEDDGSGARYDAPAAFRSYPSIRESLQDYADLLTMQMGSFYAPALKAHAATYQEACDYLQGHYATDTSYSGKLQGLIAAYGLEEYDHPEGAVGAPAAEVAAVTVQDGVVRGTERARPIAADDRYSLPTAATAAAMAAAIALALVGRALLVVRRVPGGDA